MIEIYGKNMNFMKSLLKIYPIKNASQIKKLCESLQIVLQYSDKLLKTLPESVQTQISNEFNDISNITFNTMEGLTNKLRCSSETASNLIIRKFLHLQKEFQKQNKTHQLGLA